MKSNISAIIPVPDPDEDAEGSPMVAPAPALGYSILANLGDEKQLTVQCFVDSEDPLRLIHSKIDKAMAVVDRQKAKYRKRDLLKEVFEMEATLARQEDDLARLEENFETAQKALDDRIGKAIKSYSDIESAAYGRGRSSPAGADKHNVNVLKQEVEQLRAQKVKDEAERKRARDDIAVNVGRFHDALAKHKAQIDECDALIDSDGS